MPKMDSPLLLKNGFCLGLGTHAPACESNINNKLLALSSDVISVGHLNGD